MRPGKSVLERLYHEDRLTCSQVGERFGVTQQTVGRWFRELGIELRPRNERLLEQGYPGAEVLRRLYVDERKSLAEIGRMYGSAATVVMRWMRRAEIPTRSISEATVLSGKFGVQNEAHRERLREGAAKARTKITAASREQQRQKMLGREPSNKGKPMPEEQRQRMIAQRADPEYRRRMSERMMGDKSPNWKGGVKPEDARRLDRAEWRRLRQVVYARDNWTCADCQQRCLNTKDSKLHPKLKIQAHHILPRRYGGSDDLDNLVTLCMSCHHKRERAYKPEERV